MTDPLAAYQAMDPKIRRRALLAEYRCRPRGCLLLHLWQTSQGRFWYTPAYTLSTPISERDTTESARRKRTSGGKWLPRAGSLDNLLDFFANEADVDGTAVVTGYHPGGGIPVSCPHIRAVVAAPELADLTGRAPGDGAGNPLFLPA